VVSYENPIVCRVEFLDQRAFHTPKSARSAAPLRQHRDQRKGTRRKKIEIVELWRCASCKRVFTPTPAALRNKTYPLRVVLDAITLYDLGYSLEATADNIRARYGHRVGRSTIAASATRRRPAVVPADAGDPLRQALPPPDLQVCLPPPEAHYAAREQGTPPLREHRGLPRASADRVSARAVPRQRTRVANAAREDQNLATYRRGEREFRDPHGGALIPTVGG
jgi:hypothetical protein